MTAKKTKRFRKNRCRKTAVRSCRLDLSLHRAKISATVRLNQRSNGRWYVRFTLDGKRRMLSTGETDKTLALLKLGKIVEQAILQHETGTDNKTITTFKGLVQEYKDYAEVNKETTTLEREKYTLNILMRTFGKKKLEEITQLEVERHIRNRRKQVKSSSCNRELSLLKDMLNKAVEWGCIASNPARKVKTLKEPPGRIRRLNNAERERLLDEAKRSTNPIVYPLLVTALNTGMRKGELQKLTWDDVELTRNPVVITVKQSKNNETREIPVNDILLPVLLEHYHKNIHARYVFSKPDGTPYGNWRRTFETLFRNAGVKDFHFHDFRHTFASDLAEAGCNAYTIQALMGHKTLAMSARYTHLSLDTLKGAVDKIGAKTVQHEKEDSTISQVA